MVGEIQHSSYTTICVLRTVGTSRECDKEREDKLVHAVPRSVAGREHSTYAEWSLSVVLKHRDTRLYMITSKRSQNTVNILFKTYRASLS